MKIVFIGCVQFSALMLKTVLELGGNVIGVITRKESRFNADFEALYPIAEENNIPLYFAEGNEQGNMAKWIRTSNPDAVFCFGWSYLLKKEILCIPKLGVIGYHPTALPRNRGRHPITWSLALGINETASTFFFMDEGGDSGDILNQRIVKIQNLDDAGSLYEKLVKTAQNQIRDFMPELENNTFERIPQEHLKANYWRKRGKQDGFIDWRMSSSSIYNLVRSLTKPYIGAHCLYNSKEVKIWKVEKVGNLPDNLEPGKVVSIIDRKFIVKCGEDGVIVVDHEFPVIPQKGENL